MKFSISPDAMPRLEEIVWKHNRRVEKLNKKHGTSIKKAILQRKGSSITDESGNYRLEIEVETEPAQIADWEVCGMLTATDEGYLLSSCGTALPAEQLEKYKDRGGDCDHCKMSRTRKATYILKHVSSGEVKVVGSSCVEDFSADLTADGMVNYAESLTGFEEELLDLEEELSGRGGRGMGNAMAVAIPKFLAYVRAAIRVHGWLSKAKANEFGGDPTSKIAWEAMEVCHRLSAMIESDVPERDLASGDDQPEIRVFKQLKKDGLIPTKEDEAKAEADVKEVEDFLLGATVALSDYEANVKVALNQGFTFERNVGITASICAMADRIRMDRIRKAERESGLNEYMGTVGEREVFRLKCLFVKDIEGNYGVSHLHIFADPQGRRAKWFGSGAPLAVGSIYDLLATVKNQDEYQGRKNTLLSRCTDLQGSLEGWDVPAYVDPKKSRKAAKPKEPVTGDFDVVIEIRRHSHVYYNGQEGWLYDAYDYLGDGRNIAQNTSLVELKEVLRGRFRGSRMRLVYGWKKPEEVLHGRKV